MFGGYFCVFSSLSRTLAEPTDQVGNACYSWTVFTGDQAYLSVLFFLAIYLLLGDELSWTNVDGRMGVVFGLTSLIFFFKFTCLNHLEVLDIIGALINILRNMTSSPWPYPGRSEAPPFPFEPQTD
ncbi:hypothetical protein B0T17DRAFT_270566 [Bombardia bombarda]|uniref:Uncharacterized protein n=1 Tax=Bombardia bombarda TaxID=252184 RepID=A0AA40C534_9PEZI|nr:hypothetical protein B0T17DRAFT_270566 [Bombardia bombarda]